MALKLKTAAAIKPVSIEEARRQVRADHGDDDAILQTLIDAAVAHLDGYAGVLGRCMISQVWELYYDAFPCRDLKLPLGPVTAVGSVDYVDPATGLYTTWPASNYELDLVSLDAWVIPVDGWPSVMDTSNAVRVTFTAGYGPAASDVPAALRQALLLLAGHWYMNREAVLVGEAPSELPLAVNALIGPYRRVGV